MPEYSWLLVAIVLLVPSLVVGFLRFGLRKEASAINGWGGVLFALMTFAAAIWIILEKVS
ncbi:MULTISPECIES: hypothetical protein [unclassified Luteimonas]|uniref:hypothetical protein n=1 Tax=unclassified Luteimonas TaxID=2629088 RepID=UPI0015FF19E2|nr:MULTISPECIES: hypothetical protein [unclassified Luteimonas]MBB1472949.1 hypothetical protein [Luteimonas sp. MC1782]MBB6598350.1 hypothetical protein [Luteimonas sp. MC1825]QOC88553.1 hypothetical protein IDM46_01975 [Luteimonas sp. MC1825]